MFDALVFDLDGTLWDASRASTLGWNNGLKSLNINKRVTISEMKKVIGKPAKECVDILFPSEVKQYKNLLYNLCSFERKAVESYGGKFYPSLKETIASLSRKYNLYLVSNCQRWYLDIFFNFSGLKKYFAGYDCYGISKQDKTEMLINLKKKYGFKKPAYIGDTEEDESAAKSAGYKFIFANYGFGNPNNPDVIINSLEELKSVLEVTL